jgi:hypothetical protein
MRIEDVSAIAGMVAAAIESGIPPSTLPTIFTHICWTHPQRPQ